MNISEVAKLTNLSTKSIRFYESKGIIAPPNRADNGYRFYSPIQIEQLQLISRARSVGFSLEECKGLIELSENPKRTSAEIKEKTKQKLIEIEKQKHELEIISSQLKLWLAECPGDDGADCPIMDNLKGCI